MLRSLALVRLMPVFVQFYYDQIQVYLLIQLMETIATFSE